MSMNSLEEWLQTPRGQYVLAWEVQKFDLLVADLFGFNALQIGLPEHDFLRGNRIPFRFTCVNRAGADVCCEAAELPFASQSLDLIILPHQLEFSPHPHQLLREIERVLVPEGSVVVTGFNPLSIWGLRRAFAGNMGQLPWMGQFLSVPRLKDWLTLLGFETRFGAFGCYAPPVATEIWLRRWAFMDAAGDRWWPFAGGAYILQAVKKVPGMRMITSPWRKAQRKEKKLVPATQIDGPS